jgi:hypothetical protein
MLHFTNNLNAVVLNFVCYRKFVQYTYDEKIDLREVGWDGMDWIELAQDRGQWRALMNTV